MDLINQLITWGGTTLQYLSFMCNYPSNVYSWHNVIAPQRLAAWGPETYDKQWDGSAWYVWCCRHATLQRNWVNDQSERIGVCTHLHTPLLDVLEVTKKIIPVATSSDCLFWVSNAVGPTVPMRLRCERQIQVWVVLERLVRWERCSSWYNVGPP